MAVDIQGFTSSGDHAIQLSRISAQIIDGLIEVVTCTEARRLDPILNGK